MQTSEGFHIRVESSNLCEMATADPTIARESIPLTVGALVSFAGIDGEPRPAVVVGVAHDTLALRGAGILSAVPGDRSIVGWSIAGGPHELRTHVVEVDSGAGEVSIARNGIITRTGDRRRSVRFPLVAEASLIVGVDEFQGWTSDLSLTGAALLLEFASPPVGTQGTLEIRDIDGVLLPRTQVRVAYHDESSSLIARPRIGVAFDDPERLTTATERLLVALAR